MKKITLHMFLTFAMLSGISAQNATTGNKAFDAELKKLLTFSVPVISVAELNRDLNKYKIFDAREINEYTTSHLPGAVHIGFTTIKKEVLEKIDKDENIVLYCSVGYRSEKIGEQLQQMGFKNVRNLYGSIFEWANKGYPVENSPGKNTKEIHTYNEEWSKWVTNPELRKVW